MWPSVLDLFILRPPSGELRGEQLDLSKPLLAARLKKMVRLCRNKAADSEGGRRPVPTRGNRRGDRADEVERFGRAIFVTVQSIVGDRRPLDLLILNQCFLKLRRYGEIQSSPWGAEESAFAGVGAGSRISSDRKRPPALSRPAGPRSMGKCLAH